MPVEKTPLLRAAGSSSSVFSQRSYSSVKGAAEDDDVNGDELLVKSKDGHYPYLDITRILCVVLVAIDHGNPSFGKWNVAFCQHWVLQYLYLVCGVCYAMSGRSLLSYEHRLAVYVILGIFVNWTSWVATGKNWRNDMFNVVFQLWFVVGLMLYVAILAPLKPYLSWVKERQRNQSIPEPEVEAPSATSSQGSFRPQSRAERDSLLSSWIVFGGGLILLYLMFTAVLSPLLSTYASESFLRFVQQMADGVDMWGLPQTLEQSKTFLKDMCNYFLLTSSNLYLVFVAPLYFNQTAIISWVLILNTYGQRALFFRGSNERAFHGLDLMMLAMTCYYLGLRHRRKIGKYVARYWFVIVFICSILWPPGINRRLDEAPPDPSDFRLRARLALLEFIFVVCWLCAGDRLTPASMFSTEGDKLNLRIVSEWALLLFLVHKATHIMLEVPYNWFFLVALLPTIYVARQGLPFREKEEHA